MLFDPSGRASFLVAAAALGGCTPQSHPADPEACVFVEPVTDREGRQRLDASGLPIFRLVEASDPRVGPVIAVLREGVAAQALALDRWAKREVRRSIGDGHEYGAAAKEEAAEPTTLVLSGEPEDGGDNHVGVGFAVQGRWSMRASPAPFVEVGSDPAEDTALAQTLSGRLGALSAMRIASIGGLRARQPGPHAFADAGDDGTLVHGFAMALEAMARLDPSRQTPPLSPGAGTEVQRQLAESVRENRFVQADDAGGLRHAADLLDDPGMTAAVVYRLALRSVAAREEPSALANLLFSWSASLREGTSPRDVADWVDAYGRFFPTERVDAVHTFVVSTMGATIRPGGVDRSEGVGQTVSALTALTSRVVARELSLKAALSTR